MFQFVPYTVPFRLESGKTIAILIKISVYHDPDIDPSSDNDIRIDIDSGKCRQLSIEVEAGYLTFSSFKTLSGCLVSRENMVDDVNRIIDAHHMKRNAAKCLVDDLRDTYLHLTEIFNPDPKCSC